MSNEENREKIFQLVKERIVKIATKIYKRYRLKCNKEYTSNFRKENMKEKMHLKQKFPIYIMHRWFYGSDYGIFK